MEGFGDLDGFVLYVGRDFVKETLFFWDEKGVEGAAAMGEADESGAVWVEVEFLPYVVRQHSALEGHTGWARVGGVDAPNRPGG